ncbi:MAG TPA: hypothetical protein PKB06_08915, partial [Actinotalea sp.]|nr:hypothetical protein [Actinotalea sp.]
PSEPIAESFELARAQRDVLLGEAPDVTVSRRAEARLASLRGELAATVDGDGVVLLEGEADSQLWTWAGWRANETLIAALGVDATSDNYRIDLPVGVGIREVRAARVEGALPLVSPQALDGLKFSSALPREMAVTTLAERIVDRRGAAAVAPASLAIRKGGDLA